MAENTAALHILPSVNIPSDMSQVVLRDLELAGSSPDSLAKLTQHAVVHVPLSQDRIALIIAKIRTITGGPEHMIFPVQPGKIISEITDLPPEDLSELFAMSERMIQVNCQTEPSSNKPVLFAISQNYHQGTPNPRVTQLEQATQRRLSAQSIATMHLHPVVVFDSDKQKIRTQAPHTVPKEQRDLLRDPLHPLIKSLVEVPEFAQQLMDGISTFRYEKNPINNPLLNIPLGGINFVYSDRSLASPIFASELQRLHQNYRKVYATIASQLNPKDSSDAAHARATLIDTPSRVEAITALFKSLNNTKPDSMTPIERARKRLTRLAGVLTTETEALANQKRVILQGPAYTLSILQTPGSDHWIVNIFPHGVSTGNLSETLGYVKKLEGPPTQDWYDTKKHIEEGLVKEFGSKEKIIEDSSPSIT